MFLKVRYRNCMWGGVTQSVQCLTTDWTTGVRSPQMRRMLPLACLPSPAPRSAQPPVQWVTGVLTPGVKRGRGLTLTTHPRLVLRSRISKSYTFPVVTCMAVAGRLYFTLVETVTFRFPSADFAELSYLKFDNFPPHEQKSSKNEVLRSSDWKMLARAEFGLFLSLQAAKLIEILC
jgi:hypothetical protein